MVLICPRCNAYMVHLNEDFYPYAKKDIIQEEPDLVIRRYSCKGFLKVEFSKVKTETTLIPMKLVATHTLKELLMMQITMQPTELTLEEKKRVNDRFFPDMEEFE